jgi:16S rRNA (cytidine1402-2'-O)-methyltransferase
VKSAIEDCELIFVEDTRVSIKLLNHLALKKPMVSCHKFNELSRIGLLKEALTKGQKVGIISDAGMPVISDPGHPLVAEAIKLGAQVVPIAGPSAFILALVGSGLDASRFVFEGFLPDKQNELLKQIERLKVEERTMVFYVAPHKLKRTLDGVAKICGNRRACLARELTKFYEEFIRADVNDLLKHDFEKIKGECVLVLEGLASYRARFQGELADSMDDWFNSQEKTALVREYLEEKLAQGLKLTTACKEAAEHFGIARSQVYQLSIREKAN